MSIERRKQARVAVPLQVLVVRPGEPERLLSIQDISLSGVLVLTPTVFAPVGERVALRLSLPGGVRPPLALAAETVRVVEAPPERGGGVLGLGMQFVEVSAAQLAALEALIQEALAGTGTLGRVHPRIACMLDVRWMSAGERHGVLRDIGEGGLGLFSAEPMERDSLVTVEVYGDATTTLRLSGEVVSCEPEESPAGRYRVGVRLSGVPATTRRDLQAFLAQLWRRAEPADGAASSGTGS